MVYDDFTTYTQSRVEPTIAVAPSRVTGTAVHFHTDYYLYKDFGANFFDNIIHNFTVNMSAADTSDCFFSYSLMNQVSNPTYMNVIGEGIKISTRDTKISLYSWDKTYKPYGTVIARLASSSALVIPYTYYLTLKRYEATLTLDIYTDENRTDLKENLTVFPCVRTSFRYLFPFSNNQALVLGSEHLTGYYENLERLDAGIAPKLLLRGNLSLRAK